MDDVTVYQCPECNFNADNLNELDSHMSEHHSMPNNDGSSKPGSQQQQQPQLKKEQQQPQLPQQQQQQQRTTTLSSQTSQTVNAAAVSALIENEIPTRAADRMTNPVVKEHQPNGKKSDQSQIVTTNGGNRLRQSDQQVTHTHDHDDDDENGIDHDDLDNEDDEDFFNERSAAAKFNVNIKIFPQIDKI